MQIRDRIKELRRVPASQLRPNPKNWRTHPQEQADALRGVLAEVGIADACIAREMPDGSLMLLDGHLRTETLGGEIVPVLVLDVNEKEADKILATLDPLAAMAEKNDELARKLIDEIETESEAIRKLVDDLIASEEEEKEKEVIKKNAEIEKLDKSLQLEPGKEYVVIVCDSDEEWEEMKRDLKLGLVRRGGYKKGSPFEAVGTQRVKMWKDYKEGR